MGALTSLRFFQGPSFPYGGSLGQQRGGDSGVLLQYVSSAFTHVSPQPFRLAFLDGSITLSAGLQQLLQCLFTLVDLIQRNDGTIATIRGVSFFNIAPEWMFHPACRMPKSIARLGAFLHVQFLPQSAKKLNKCHFSGFIMPKKAKESKNNQCIYDLPPSSSSLRQCIKKWVHSSESTKAFQQLYPYYLLYMLFFHGSP